MYHKKEKQKYLAICCSSSNFKLFLRRHFHHALFKMWKKLISLSWQCLQKNFNTMIFFFCLSTYIHSSNTRGLIWKKKPTLRSSHRPRDFNGMLWDFFSEFGLRSSKHEVRKAFRGSTTQNWLEKLSEKREGPFFSKQTMLSEKWISKISQLITYTRYYFLVWI